MVDDEDVTPIFPHMDQLDGMRVLSRAGIGKRSHWYKATQVRLNRTVAVKCLRPILAASPDVTESFFQAARQAALIVHPAAVPVINVFPTQKCIVHQWCAGKPLRDCKNILAPAAAAGVGMAVMDCLASLHATGRSHGNLSPGNVFLDEEGVVGVDDFFQPAFVRVGEVKFMGDQQYIPPEILAGGEPDWRSDVFSLARTLHYAWENPETSCPGLAELLRSLQADDPAARAASPDMVRAAFKQVRDDEEVRLGLSVGGGKRGQRRYRRVPAEFEVALRRRSATPVETAALLTRIRDIGESGVFVETEDDSMPVGTILELDFALKGAGGNVHAFGIVRWKSSSPMPPGGGVQFVEGDRAGLDRLRQLLHNQ